VGYGDSSCRHRETERHGGGALQDGQGLGRDNANRAALSVLQPAALNP
jgi:hypothetical protein